MAEIPGLKADVYFGDAEEKPLPPWRRHIPDRDDEDDEDKPLSAAERAALVGILGFDPAELEDGSEPKHESHSEGDGDSGQDIALHGADGRKAESLLENSKREGAARIAEIARPAVERALRNPAKFLRSDKFLDDSELADLADVMADVTGTADLLGRSRMRRRLDQAERGGDKFSEDDATDFSCFDEGIKPLPPSRALAYFRGLVPGLVANAEAWSEGQHQRGFMLAVTSDLELLKKVKEAIRSALESGAGYRSGTKAVDKIMDDAGISPRNPQYGEMVTRSAMANSYNEGWDSELKEPDVQEAFPVWRYANPNDNRSRPTHAARNGKYYSSAVSFADVRGRGIEDYANDRCTGIPVWRGTWQKLQRNGNRIEPFAAKHSEDATGHQHKDSGPGGGQFTSKGGSGGDSQKSAPLHLMTHSQQVILSLNKDQRSAIREYMDQGYEDVNKAMRKCPPDFHCVGPDERYIMDGVESAIASAPDFESPVNVYRGMTGNDKTMGDLLSSLEDAKSSGKEFSLPSITSTTIDPEVVKTFSGTGKTSKAVVFSIKAKRGLYVESLTVKGANQGEHEVLKSSKNKYKVTGITPGKGHGETVIEMEEV